MWEGREVLGEKMSETCYTFKAESNNSEKRIDELEKRVVDLERRLAEVMLVMLRMCPGGVGCPYADRSGTMIPDTGDAVRPWDITYTR